jgi:hypothetical protein
MVWEKAYEDYFVQRLRLRYLDPIKVLQENGTYQGEGFSIVAIQCTLVEFLESTLQGVRYRYLGRGESPGEYEYSSSREIFTQFLTTRKPFSDYFDNSLAMEFYVNIRCALLHEACTKNGWRIWAKNSHGKIVEAERKIVFRDDFQNAFLTFIQTYKHELMLNPSLQQAFIRKFDSLCE